LSEKARGSWLFESWDLENLREEERDRELENSEERKKGGEI